MKISATVNLILLTIEEEIRLFNLRSLKYEKKKKEKKIA